MCVLRGEVDHVERLHVDFLDRLRCTLLPEVANDGKSSAPGVLESKVRAASRVGVGISAPLKVHDASTLGIAKWLKLIHKFSREAVKTR